MPGTKNPAAYDVKMSHRLQFRAAHLVPAEVVDEDHADEDDQQAETLEGQHGQPKDAILLGHAGGVVLAVGAALLARQAVPGRVLIAAAGTAIRCGASLHRKLCERERERE